MPCGGNGPVIVCCNMLLYLVYLMCGIFCRKVWKTRLEVQLLHFWVFYYSEINKILFLLIDNIPKIRYTIEGREV